MVFIDIDNKCHVTNDGTMRGFETELIAAVFNGKCSAYIEGCRYIPEGEFWTNSEGKVYSGEAIFLWKDSAILAAYQEQYEAMLAELEAAKADLADADAALDELGVEWGADNG